MDIGHRETDLLIDKMERKIRRTYLQAQSEAQEKLDSYLEKFAKKDAIKAKQVKEGKITAEEYSRWRKGQICIGKRWQEMVDTLTQDYVNADKIAMSVVNGQTAYAYAINHNYATFQVEQESFTDTSYTLYDRRTVERLLRDNPRLLPKGSVNIPKDMQWNRQHVNNAIVQGILQGESIDKISRRLRSVTDMDNSAAVRNARTMITGAQNAGRVDGFKRAQKMGINLEQMWIATLDGRTRHSHRQLDGHKVKVGEKFPNGCMYPGDPEGPPWEVYNCRCTLIAAVAGVDYGVSDLTNRNSKLGDMSYEEWKHEHDDRELNRITNKTLKKAKENEQAATSALQDAIKGTNGKLEGLDFRIKGQGSLKRKIRDKSIKKGMTQEQYAATITDALRYTVQSPTEDFTANFFAVQKRLKEKGFDMVEVVNTLKYKDAPYRGINTLVRTNTGYVFELQFHTDKSLSIKEINHLLYEEQRLATTAIKRQRELNRIMAKNAASIPTPPNIDSILDVQRH